MLKKYIFRLIIISEKIEEEKKGKNQYARKYTVCIQYIFYTGEQAFQYLKYNHILETIFQQLTLNL